MPNNKETKYTLYKIFYYDDVLMYLGRTKQPLTDRIRGHLFKIPTLKAIDIHQVQRIEFAEFKTEADMFLYEIYYINKFKPPLNTDDKAHDELTISLPTQSFSPWTTPLWEKWQKEIDDKDAAFIAAQKERNEKELEWSRRKEEVHEKYKNGEIDGDTYLDILDSIKNERTRYDYETGRIGFGEYSRRMGFHQVEQ